jgi:hypothetical protein
MVKDVYFLFQSELQLSTTSKTSFKPIEEFDIVEVDDSVDNVIKSVGTVISCALKIISKCVSCNKSLAVLLLDVCIVLQNRKFLKQD